MKLNKTPLPILLGIAHRAVEKKFMQIIDHVNLDVTFDQFIVLLPIGQENGITQQGIVNSCGKDKTSVTRIINTLENKNLAIRIKDLNDGRLNHIYLTKHGKKMLNKVFPTMEETRDYCKKDINEDDFRTTRSVIIKLIKKLENDNG